ncbi:MarR family transcriptional regulator [Roseomonas sp. OT10]|uniref:MarR family winged helix-turn-helix transcriptional regulator n=1 Tax=Roseomonas cutis TaxID=2897332 RepID=UPI001E29F9BB|nr:MarR family transcriptional regulator [Roseomonas sp. OT10]UFN48997.1 MarR family transcriptional regulator [Roseomonas sp. OT10]
MSRPQPLDELYALPGHLIRRVQQISTALFAEECGSFDLTSVQYAALVAIQAVPEVDATRLSALIAFDRSTLGDVLERLETKGWVARAPSRQDRRVKRLTLTPEGMRVVREVEPGMRRVQERLLAPLAPEEGEALVRLLARIADVHNDVLPAPLRATG